MRWGVPYIQYSISVPYELKFGNHAKDFHGKAAFSRIRILGNICHFNIEDHIKKNDAKYSQRYYSSDIHGSMVRSQRILKLSTGNIYDYDEYILSQLMKDDEQLVAQFLKEDNKEANMFRYMQKYNERNPVLNRSVVATKE